LILLKNASAFQLKHFFLKKKQLKKLKKLLKKQKQLKNNLNGHLFRCPFALYLKNGKN